MVWLNQSNNHPLTIGTYWWVVTNQNNLTSRITKLNNSSFKLNAISTQFISISEQSPNSPHSFQKTSNLSGLVITSANCSHVPQCTNSTVPAFVSSQRKWKHTSMCLLQPCITGFLESLMAELLSQRIIVGLPWFWPSFPNTFFNHTTWHAHEAAINFAFVEDRLTIGCFFNDHWTQ